MEGNCKTTGIGSVPFTDVKKGMELVKTLDIPFWPQFPQIDTREGMYLQFSEGLPGLKIEKDKVFVDSEDFEKNAEKFFELVVSDDLGKLKLSKKYSKGFYELLRSKQKFDFVKGQITGPISFGLQVCDQNKKPILYNELMMDALVKNLLAKAKFQVQELNKMSNNLIMFIDEPFMSAFGSAMISLSREQVISYLNEILNNLDCIKGIHCCSNTDWSVLLDANIEIISFDAYEYFDKLLIYTDKLKKFLNDGKILAWGIVPTNKSDLNKETADKLVEKLELQVKELSKKTNIKAEQIFKQSLITPSCGTGSLEENDAIKVFDLTKAVSLKIREKYSL